MDDKNLSEIKYKAKKWIKVLYQKLENEK